MKPDSIVFVPSYPRSGNTFARILLAAYNGVDDLDRLEEALPADTSAALWRSVPDQEVSARNNRAFRRQVLAEYRRRSPALLPFRGLKTHTANLWAFGAPAFEFKPDDRIIHLVRNPLDVVLSNADFNDHDIERSIEVMINSGTCVASGSLGSVEVRGSWRENVESWLKPEICPALLVRYEDLLADTELWLRRIVEFIGLPFDEARLMRAVERSQFSRLQRQEKEQGFSEAPARTTSGRFFREGKSGQWRTALTPDQIARLTAHGGEVMARLGYP